MTFSEYLISTYCEDPCRVLPNALWKTLTGIGDFETSLEIENKVVMSLQMWLEFTISNTI